MSVYTDNWYENRGGYLKSLAEDYGIELHIVESIAGLLGENEDFDGLVTSLQDYTGN